jgi:hypothetical protein
MTPLKVEVERMLAERCSFSAIEARIEHMACTSEIKSALWLFAWNHQAPAERDRTVDQILVLAAHPQG